MAEKKQRRRRRGLPEHDEGVAVGAAPIRPVRQPEDPLRELIPVVAIGASAGGLEAFAKFFRTMPAQPGIAFVLVMHLDRTRESMKVELLRKHTSMPVAQATDGMPIQRDHVYIVPPNKQLAVKNDILHLSRPLEKRGQQTPIDRFFRALAQDQGERAIAILLSGTGSDGTEGIKAIKANGGLVLVQEPTEAEHDEMPRSAIATGMVDQVLPLDRMHDLLERYIRPPYMHLHAQEIAERARAEAALRKSEERFRLLTEHAPVGIFQTDVDGLCTFANRRFCEIVDLAPDLLLGRHFTMSVAAVDLEQIHEDALARARDAGRWSHEYRYRTPDGRDTWVYGSVVPLLDEGGQITGFLGTCIDISERKQVDEQRRHLEAQMMHAQKLESLGVLAGGIAHDFNNLLVAILGNAQIAEAELQDGSPMRAREPLRDIEMGARRAADLCRQLLAYSGKGRFVVQSLDLGQVVKEMTHLLEVSISKKAELRYDLPQGLPPIEADTTQVQQIVMNLITNASEALGERHGTIEVSTGVMACDAAYLGSCYLDDNLAPGRYVYLEVCDTGCGLDEETRARMFDPFFTTKFTGRGLGLAAVLGIVRGHRAAIKVDSALGRGTRFRVLFPASEKQVKVESDADGKGRIARGRGTVLVVDDEPSVLKVVKRALTNIGLDVITSANGRDALDIFQQKSGEIDCVLLDLTMPDMDGDELFGALRRIRGDIRVFLMSGYSEQEISLRFIGQGLTGFVQKPFDLNTLQRAIGGALGLSKVKTEPPPFASS